MSNFCKNVSFCLIIGWFCSAGKLENDKIDSLKEALFSSQNSQEKGLNLSKLSFEYLDYSMDSAVHYAKKLLIEAKKCNDKLLISESYCKLGMATLKLGDNHAEGLSLILKGLRIRDSMGDFSFIAKCYLDLGNLQLNYYQSHILKQNDTMGGYFFSKAEEYYKRSYSYSKKSNNKESINDVRSNLGGLYSTASKYDLALAFYDSCRVYYAKRGDFINLADLKGKIGIVQMYKGDLSLAYVNFSESLKSSQKEGNRLGIFYSYFNIAEAKSIENKNLEALGFLANALLLSRKLNRKDLEIYVLEFISAMHKEQKQFDSAYIYLKEYDSLNNLMVNEANRNEISRLSIVYESERKDRINFELKANKLKQANNIRMLIAALGLLLLLLIVITISFLYYRQSQLAKELVNQQKLTEVERAQDQKVVKAMLNGQEKERNRVATELHDSMGSLLSMMKLYITELKNSPLGAGTGQSNDPTELRPVGGLEKTSQLIELAVQELRHISTNLSSGILVTSGLVPALREMVEIVNQTRELNVSVHSIGLEGRYSSFVEVSVYRVIQELLTNTLKHAEAKSIEIRLEEDGTHLSVQYTDDGNGMDYNTRLKASKGLGLANIKNRVLSAKGTICFKENMPSGVLFNILIPIS